MDQKVKPPLKKKALPPPLKSLNISGDAPNENLSAKTEQKAPPPTKTLSKKLPSKNISVDALAKNTIHSETPENPPEQLPKISLNKFSLPETNLSKFDEIKKIYVSDGDDPYLKNFYASITINPQQTLTYRNPETFTRQTKNAIQKKLSITKEDKEKLAQKFQTLSIDNVFKYQYTEHHIRMHQALELLNDYENATATVETGEFLRTRYTLRNLMLKAHADGRFADALTEALAILELTKAYYGLNFGLKLVSDMILELLVICRSCSLCNQTDKGLQYFTTLQHIINSTLLHFKPDMKIEIETFPENTAQSVLKCDETTLCELVYQTSRLATTYKLTTVADNYMRLFIEFSKHVYKDSLDTAHANTRAAHYFYITKRYDTALVYAKEALRLFTLLLGDYWNVPPHPTVADCYSNYGLLLRLNGNLDDALTAFYTALDMQLRLHKKNPAVPSVQDLQLCIGIIHHQLTNFRVALELYEKVRQYRSKTLGQNHPHTRHVIELIKELNDDLQGAADMAIQRPFPSSPRGTMDGYLLDELMNPNVFSKRTHLRALEKIDEPPNIDVYRFTIPTWQQSYVNRMKVLYGETIQNLSVPSTAILPFVHAEIVGPDLLALSAAMDSLKLPYIKTRKLLPIINIPKSTYGIPYIENESLNPQFELNPKAKSLYEEWGLEPVQVDENTGNVTEKKPIGFPLEIPLYLPIWDVANKAPLKGLNNVVLTAPNPLIPFIDLSELEGEVKKMDKPNLPNEAVEKKFSKAIKAPKNLNISGSIKPPAPSQIDSKVAKKVLPPFKSMSISPPEVKTKDSYTKETPVPPSIETPKKIVELKTKPSEILTPKKSLRDSRKFSVKELPKLTSKKSFEQSLDLKKEALNESSSKQTETLSKIKNVNFSEDKPNVKEKTNLESKEPLNTPMKIKLPGLVPKKKPEAKTDRFSKSAFSERQGELVTKSFDGKLPFKTAEASEKAALQQALSNKVQLPPNVEAVIPKSKPIPMIKSLRKSIVSVPQKFEQPVLQAQMPSKLYLESSDINNPYNRLLINQTVY